MNCDLLGSRFMSPGAMNWALRCGPYTHLPAFQESSRHSRYLSGIAHEWDPCSLHHKIPPVD